MDIIYLKLCTGMHSTKFRVFLYIL